MKLIKKYSADILAVLAISGILYLFYRSFWAFILIPVLLLAYKKISTADSEKKYKNKAGLQFKDALISLSGALRAGYSIENALYEAYEEMKMMYGSDSYICVEFKKMMNQMRLGMTAERAFDDFANRSGIEDIKTFSEVFKVAKRSGGDIVEIIRKTADDIAAKAETKNEISVLVASKRFEQNIMNIVPLGMILYISMSSNGLLDPLYGNVTGIVIMTLCLAMYAAAFILSKKIMDIEV